MSKWKRTVPIKDLLQGEGTSDDIRSAVDGIMTRLPEAPSALLLRSKELADIDPDFALIIFNMGL